MKKLMIIGNGFDLAHKLPTRYEDFRLYLQALCSEGNSFFNIPESRTNGDGEEVFDE